MAKKKEDIKKEDPPKKLLKKEDMLKLEVSHLQRNVKELTIENYKEQLKNMKLNQAKRKVEDQLIQADINRALTVINGETKNLEKHSNSHKKLIADLRTKYKLSKTEEPFLYDEFTGEILGDTVDDAVEK